jgi:electron transport complex protein RnfB
MYDHSYRALAHRLDALPSGFPATEEGVELELLARLFTSVEAGLAAHLKLGLESPGELAARSGLDVA